MIRIGAIFLLLCSPILLWSQLVKLDELVFSSDLEQEAISSFVESGNKDFIALFMTLDAEVSDEYLESGRNRYLEELAAIDLKKLNRKKPKAKIEFIYNKIHDGLFKRYEEKNYFSEIFTNGEYNCVSATALYGMVFDELNIPYTVRENPTHVYIIAYPESENILVESTAPATGFNLYDDAFKRVFVNKLADNKIISETEFNKENYNSLFDKYYFNDDDITLSQLIGIQYMNDAIYALDNENYKRAFQQLEKAWLFYPSEKCSYMMLMTAVQMLEKGDYYNQPEKIDLLIKLTRFTEHGISEDMILGEYGKIIESILIQNSDADQMDKILQKLLKEIGKTDLGQEIKFVHHYERGRVLYNLGKFKSALPLLEVAHETSPNDANGRGVLASVIMRIANNNPDPENRAIFLESKLKTYTSLSENANILQLLGVSYLEEFSRNFRLQKPIEGDKWRMKFELLHQDRNDLSVPYQSVGEAYSAASVYYFRKGQKSKARQYLETGLKLSPNNFELMQRLQMIR